MNMKILLGAAVVALSAVSGSAMADDGKGYHGSTCDAYYSSQSGDLSASLRGIYNRSSDSRWVNCPVIQDSVYNLNGTKTTTVFWTGTGVLSCSLRSMNPDGTTRQTQSASSALSFGSTLPVRIPHITSDHRYGSYTLICYLPAKATLISFRVTEKT